MFPLLSFGQLDHVLKSFNAIVDDGQIILNWTMFGGYQCNGTVIERSVDGDTFYPIGNIPGICGDPVNDESYSFVDTMPVLNSINYYRLELQFYGISHVIQRELFDLSGGYLILPNPVISSGKIKFANPNADNFILNLYSTSGQLVYTQNTILDYFDIDVVNHKNGIYVFVIRSETGRLIKGRIVIGSVLSKL